VHYCSVEIPINQILEYLITKFISSQTSKFCIHVHIMLYRLYKNTHIYFLLIINSMI
jgi:hypothetical protein